MEGRALTVLSIVACVASNAIELVVLPSNVNVNDPLQVSSQRQSTIFFSRMDPPPFELENPEKHEQRPVDLSHRPRREHSSFGLVPVTLDGLEPKLDEVPSVRIASTGVAVSEVKNDVGTILARSPG
jgi:hypothetical protein